MSEQRKALDLGKLNDWVNNPASKKRLEEAKHKQLMIAMKKELAKSEKEAQFFSITEDEEEVTIALQRGLPSDNDLNEMKTLYGQIDKLENNLQGVTEENILYEGALNAKESQILSLESQLAEYHQSTLWERFMFLFTGRI